MVEDMNRTTLKGFNFIDKTIAYISPRAGISRLHARRSYEAASVGRRAKSFRHASSTGANLEISQALVKLRDRSRHFVRNNGWAKRAISVITDTTVGEGIRPAPRGTINQVKKIKSVWRNWAETTNCDWDGKNTFYGLQNLIMSEIAEAGDCLIIRRHIKPTINNPIPIQLQIVEGDQLDQSRDSVNEFGFARLGVQFDKEGKRTGYWIYPQHPNDMTGFLQPINSELISKDDIIHPFEILRAGQVRGVPMGIASFVKMSDFSDYEDAQLVRQKAAAAFCAFVTGADSTKTDDKLETLEPGIIEYLNENETITFASPPSADGYGEYSKKILQGIAASYCITYEQLTMDYSNVNYTSGKMAKNDTIGRIRKLQYQMFVPQVCSPVWNWFMQGCMMVGITNSYLECNAQDWTAPKILLVDAVKETNAVISQLSAGLTTWSEVIRENGRDPDEFLEEYKADMQKLKDAGVNFTSVQMSPMDNTSNSNNNNQ